MTFLQATVIAAICFGSGVVLGMLLYRVVWHVDTVSMRSEIDKLRVVNEGLYSEIVRLSVELGDLQVRVVEVETAGRSVQADLHAALRR